MARAPRQAGFPDPFAKGGRLQKSPARSFWARQNASAATVPQAPRRVNSFDERKFPALILRGSGAAITAGAGIAFDRGGSYSTGGRNRFSGMGVYVCKPREAVPDSGPFQGEPMKIRFAALFGALMLASASALAFHCPADMKKIDAALEKNPKLSAQQMADVRKFRADGEALHKAGKHQESGDTVAKPDAARARIRADKPCHSAPARSLPGCRGAGAHSRAGRFSLEKCRSRNNAPRSVQDPGQRHPRQNTPRSQDWEAESSRIPRRRSRRAQQACGLPDRGRSIGGGNCGAGRRAPPGGGNPRISPKALERLRAGRRGTTRSRFCGKGRLRAESVRGNAPGAPPRRRSPECCPKSPRTRPSVPRADVRAKSPDRRPDAVWCCRAALRGGWNAPPPAGRTR